MDDLNLRVMASGDWNAVAELVYLSTNYWYRANGKSQIFTGDPARCTLFCRVYEYLDPGCCLVVENARTGQIVGSCFYHPRATHISVGIVNVHPSYAGRGVARRMLAEVIAKADAEGKPIRLVSSAMNLDSFSLYTRAGFVPRTVFHDMFVPVEVAAAITHSPGVETRDATFADLTAIVALERDVSGLERETDYRYFLENREGIWHVSVALDGKGGISGVLASVAHPASRLLGPGVMRTEDIAAALIRAELIHHRGHSPVFLVPADRPALVAEMYALGAKNCEIHVAQVRGAWTPPGGVVMPTFMPETG